MESEKLSSSGLHWLCREADNCSSAADPPATAPAPAPEPSLPQQVAVLPDSQAEATLRPRRRRGRPPKGEGRPEPPPPVKRRKKKEDEDVCFICFDGGSLVLCDQGDCPKAYHPACIKRDEAFFSSDVRWTCGWHICSKCQKSVSRYMCYTCTYSLCKGCREDADFLSVRGNKGLCSTCFRVVMMIENIDQGNDETVKVDFDDKLSWEYLFKIYWICLKRDLSLTVDEITRAQKPSIAPIKVAHREKSSAVGYPGNNGTMARENPASNGTISYTSFKSVRDNNNNNPVVSTAWASKELLNFVAYMRNGDTSALSQKEVQALLFDHIKRNNLRDPHQRSEIICDSELESLFGKPRVRHFEMLSLLEFHFLTKDESRKDETEGDIINPVVRQVAGESNSDNLPLISETYRHKVDKKDEERVDINRVSEGNDACEKLDNHVESSGSTNNGPNNQTCLKSEALSGFKPETSVVSLSTGSTPSANDREAENSWHYRDPKGKVQGPFGIEQLHKWSSTGIFPPEMRIWRLNTEERDSVLLTDVIKGQVPLQNNLSLSPREAKGTSDGTSHHRDGPWSGNANSAGMDTDAHSSGALETVKCNVPLPHFSNLTAPVIYKDPQINNDALIDNSSKCSDLDPPKVINSYPNLSEVHSVEQSSPFTEQPHETCVHHDRSNVRQTLNPTSNYENWNSQGVIAPQFTGREYNENQVNEQRYLVQPYSEGPLHQNTSVKYWNSQEAHPHYVSPANLSDTSEQKRSMDLQDFPMPMPKGSTGVLEAQTIKEQQRWQPQQVSVQNLSIQNVLGLTSKLTTDQDEKNYFPIQKTASLTDNFEKIRAAEDKHSLSPNCPAQDSGASWSSASSLVLGAGSHLPKKVNKPSMEEWDSGFLSASSLRPHDVANDHVATPTSRCDELPPPSPPNPVPNASSWLAMMIEPIEFNTLAEESVSDLLAEVDAMESNSDVASPNMLMDYVDDLFNDSKTDCFTALRGLSTPLGRGEIHGLSFSGDIMLPPQSSTRDEQIRAHDYDVLDPVKKSKRHSSTSSVIPANQFETGSNRNNPSPPKKTRDLADILNAPTKHGILKSPGATRRESGQGTPRESGGKNRSTSGGMPRRESSHQKHSGERPTYPQDRNVSGLTSTRDRNVAGGNSGFSKGRQSWSRQ